MDTVPAIAYPASRGLGAPLRRSVVARLFAYRDESGLEADAAIEMPDGRWAAVEVKLGLGDVEVTARRFLGDADVLAASLSAAHTAVPVLTDTANRQVATLQACSRARGALTRRARCSPSAEVPEFTESTVRTPRTTDPGDPAGFGLSGGAIVDRFTSRRFRTLDKQ